MPDRQPENAVQRPISPGTYVRLRREHAGWTLDQLALQLGTRPGSADIRTELDALEADAPGDHLALVWRLVHVFRIDPHIYLALAGHAADPDSGLPSPRICRGCGCSWNDPCRIESNGPDDGEPCSWAGDSDWCTACAQRAAPTPPAPGPAVTALHHAAIAVAVLLASWPIGRALAAITGIAP